MNKDNFSLQMSELCKKMRASLKVKPRDISWRRDQLVALKKLLVENENRINEAMWKDLHKGPFECSATEQGIVLSEIDHVLGHLESWMKAETVTTPLYNQMGTSHIQYEPLGLTLVIGAWNYPVNLLLAPVVGAISGGNAVILKPSEISANTATLIAELIPHYMDTDLIAVVQGGADETDVLLDQKMDLIFFTGSGPVGKIIMTKAAAQLTPVVLELGGKSPGIVLEDADVKTSAKRLTWGKFMNAGQTCVCPDYILVQRAVKEELIREIKLCLEEFYGADIQSNKDYCRIVNDRNFDRLTGLLSDAKVIAGGKNNKEDRFIEPTLLECSGNEKVMLQEVFGPLWPIIEMDGVSDIIEFVNGRDKPLALYVFSENDEVINRILDETSSGGVSVNDTIMHMASPQLPFGGVGASGMGNYHGHFSFKTFTHAKSVYRKSTLIDIPLRYAPYTDSKLKWMKRFFN